MRMVMILLIFLLTATSGAIAKEAPVFEGPQAEIDAILELFKQWEMARNSGDSDAVANMYHEDMLIMTRNRSLLRGHQGAKTFYAENYSESSDRELLGSMLELRVFNEVAFVVGQFLVLDKKNEIEDPGYYLIILRKNKAGDWRIYRDIDTPSPDGLMLKSDT